MLPLLSEAPFPISLVDSVLPHLSPSWSEWVWCAPRPVSLMERAGVACSPSCLPCGVSGCGMLPLLSPLWSERVWCAPPPVSLVE